MFSIKSNPSGSQNNILKQKFLWGHAVLFGGLMVLVWLVEVLFDTSFSRYGLKPRNPAEIWRVVVFPFLHSDLNHIVTNLVPFSILSLLVFNMFPRHSWKVYLLTFGLSGFWTWCFARPGTVVGASGWVYALLGFLLWAGFTRTSHRAMAVAGGLAFLYGGFVTGLVPIVPNISWEGHLMGLLSGFTAAIYWGKELGKYHVEAPKPSKPWQEPPYPYWLYDQPHVLDEHGQVISPELLEWVNGKPRLKSQSEETLPQHPSDQLDSQPQVSHTMRQPIKVTYVIVPGKSS